MLRCQLKNSMGQYMRVVHVVKRSLFLDRDLTRINRPAYFLIQSLCHSLRTHPALAPRWRLPVPLCNQGFVLLDGDQTHGLCLGVLGGAHYVLNDVDALPQGKFRRAINDRNVRGLF